MGFLDFLKKDKPAPRDVQMPLPPGATPELPPAPLPADPMQIDWNQPPKMQDPFAQPRQDNAIPTGSMLANPLRSNPLPAELDNDDGDFEHIPLPPVSMQDPDFLQSAADDMKPPQTVEKIVEKVVEKIVEVPAAPPVPVAQSPDISKIELPDFTDEELEAWSTLQPAPAAQPPAVPPAMSPVLPPIPPPTRPAAVEIITEEPLIEPPANAVAIPPEEFRLPTGEDLEIGRIEPAKFLSSDSYFGIIADIKAMRKSLRQNDDVIKEAVLRHEQLDLQYKRVAADINAVQEQFMKIDEALFEE